MSSRRSLLMGQTKANLLYLDQSVVSMICYDGSDGKGNSFQLDPIFDDGIPRLNKCNWSSSNESIASVSSSGNVSVINGGYGDFVISCTYRGVTKTCLFTAFQTMPLANIDGQGLWALKGGCGGKIDNGTGSLVMFRASPSTVFYKVDSMRIDIKSYTPGGDDTIFVCRDDPGKLDGAKIQFNKNPERIFFSKHRGNIVYTQEHAISIDNVLNVSITNTDILYINDSVVSSTSTWTEPNTYTSATVMFFNNSTKKIVRGTTGIGLNDSALRDRAQCDRFYIPQNYIRYQDTQSRTNYTVIPNIGTLGSAYDLSANNVPAIWYGV